MRIIIQKPRNGMHEITIVPGRSLHLAPVTLRGSSKRVVLEALGAELAELDRVLALPESPGNA